MCLCTTDANFCDLVCFCRFIAGTNHIRQLRLQYFKTTNLKIIFVTHKKVHISKKVAKKIDTKCEVRKLGLILSKALPSVTQNIDTKFH